jgi:D-3-phosphoglycerate dehydrogenase
MKWRVLVSAPYIVPVIDSFRDLFAAHDVEVIVPPVRERLEEEDLLAWIAGVHGVICGDDRFTERVMRAAPELRVISKWGTGIDSIDRDAAARLGIQVCSTPNAFSEPVADSVLGYMLCFARQLPWMDADIRGGAWHKRPSMSLRETTLGIVGVGNVGKAVARRARAFGSRILGHDIVAIPEEFQREVGLEVVSKDELLGAADFVSLNCDLNPTSYHLIGDRELHLTRRSAVIINTARGQLIDEPALVRALYDGRIAGAALDVFEREPLPADSPLRGYENVLLAPHNANSSPRAWERVHQSTLENLFRCLAERAPQG